MEVPRGEVFLFQVDTMQEILDNAKTLKGLYLVLLIRFVKEAVVIH